MSPNESFRILLYITCQDTPLHLTISCLNILAFDKLINYFNFQEHVAKMRIDYYNFKAIKVTTNNNNDDDLLAGLQIKI